MGNLYLTDKSGAGEFTPEDEEALVLFAAQAALAVHNAHQYEALEVERRRLESLVSLSPIGVLMVETGSERVLTANREAERILGFSYEAGNTLRDLDNVVAEAPDGEILGHDLPILRALAKGETVRAEEVVYRLPNGRTVPTLVSATPIRGDQGEVAAAVSIIQDVSPLEELERLKSEFLGIVSHELRTPLTAIKGASATVLGSAHPRRFRSARDLPDGQRRRCRHRSSPEAGGGKSF